MEDFAGSRRGDDKSKKDFKSYIKNNTYQYSDSKSTDYCQKCEHYKEQTHTLLIWMWKNVSLKINLFRILMPCFLFKFLSSQARVKILEYLCMPRHLGVGFLQLSMNMNLEGFHPRRPDLVCYRGSSPCRLCSGNRKLLLGCPDILESFCTQYSTAGKQTQM